MISTKDTSPWKNDKKVVYPRLSQSLEADVVIIGGGITGLLSAYLLSKAGIRVILFEKNKIGSGATALTTAWITQSIDIDFSDLEKSLPIEQAQAVLSSHKKAIELITKIVKEHNIDCDFKNCSTYIYAKSTDELGSLGEECKSAKRLDISATMHTNKTELGFKNEGYIEIEDQAMFEPMKFLIALAEITTTQGVRIFESTEVDNVKAGKDGVIVTIGDYLVRAKWAISATYEPFHEPLRLFFEKGMYTTYVFELLVKDMKLQEGLIEDMENPYHYIRIEKKNEGYRVILGGEDHRSDVPVSHEKSFNALKVYADSLFPDANYEIISKWQGPILEPVDGLALIGPMNADPILYASAFSGNGMTYAAIAAKIFLDYVQNVSTIEHAIYSPKRVAHLKALMHKGADYVEEFIDGAVKNTFTQKGELDSKIEKEK